MVSGQYMWKIKFSICTSSHTFRQPVSVALTDPFVIEVTVRDMHPGLTSEEALIGTRTMNSVNAFHVHCTHGDQCVKQTLRMRCQPLILT